MKYVFLALVLVTGTIAGVTRSKPIEQLNTEEELQAELKSVHDDESHLQKLKHALNTKIQEAKKKPPAQKVKIPPVVDDQPADGETYGTNEQETETQDQEPQQEETQQGADDQGENNPGTDDAESIPQELSDTVDEAIGKSQQIANGNEDSNEGLGSGEDSDTNESINPEESEQSFENIPSSKPAVKARDVLKKATPKNNEGVGFQVGGNNGGLPKNLVTKSQPAQSTKKAIDSIDPRIQDNIDRYQNAGKDFVNNIGNNVNKNLKNSPNNVQLPEPQEAEDADIHENSEDALNALNNAGLKVSQPKKELSNLKKNVQSSKPYQDARNALNQVAPRNIANSLKNSNLANQGADLVNQASNNKNFGNQVQTSYPSNQRILNNNNPYENAANDFGNNFEDAADEISNNRPDQVQLSNQNAGVKFSGPKQQLNNFQKNIQQSKPYQDARNALNQITPDNIIDSLKNSDLVNQGADYINQARDAVNRKIPSNVNVGGGNSNFQTNRKPVQQQIPIKKIPVPTYPENYGNYGLDSNDNSGGAFEASVNTGNGRGSVQGQALPPVRNQETVNLRQPHIFGVPVPSIKIKGGILPNLKINQNNQGRPAISANGENGQLSIKGNAGGPSFNLGLGNQGGQGYNVKGQNGQFSISGNPGGLIPTTNFNANNQGNSDYQPTGGAGQLSYKVDEGPQDFIPLEESNSGSIGYDANSGVYYDQQGNPISFEVSGVGPEYITSPEDSNQVSAQVGGGTSGNGGYHFGDISNNVVDGISSFVKPVVDDTASIPSSVVDVTGNVANKFIDGAENIFKKVGDTLGNVRSTLHNTRQNVQHNTRTGIRNFVDGAAGKYKNGW